jgi:ketosteroid isomerase-like protein
MRILFTLLASILLGTASISAGAQDVTAPIHQFLDGLNAGDATSVKAAYATGDIFIVDEIAPHSWSGPNAHQQWSADIERHDATTGVTDGSVKYSAPTRTEVEADYAYVIVPTVYLCKERGKPMAEEANMTFVLRRQSGAWKISGWVWSGAKPHPAK